MLTQVLQTIDGRQHQALALLKEFLTFASVSAQPVHEEDCRQCAQWVADQCRAAMLEVAVMETGGRPCVVAKNRPLPGRATVLLYGHYDVQPSEPDDLWKSPPFTPVVRDNASGESAVFARGAADDKGPVLCHLEAITAWQAHGGLPVNLTVLIEGEEEVGSVHLEEFVRHHRDALAADVCVISDSNGFARGHPAITTGTRGLVYQEVTVTGANRDLHSGLFGGAAPNAANVLVELLATLHDRDGRVTLNGFYDNVVEMSADDKAAWKKLPFSEADYAADLGVAETTGEAGYSSIERTWARPTCDMNGIVGGYTGPGAKTVIPARASAKVSFRLVANQDPAKVVSAFQQHLRDRAPAGVTLNFVDHGQAPAYLVPPDHPGLPAAMTAVETGFGQPATLIRSGGSIPIVSTFKEVLGIDVLFVGFGLPDDNVHSPNEKFDLACLHRGARTAAAIYDELSRVNFSGTGDGSNTVNA